MPRRLRAFFRTRTLQGSTGFFAVSGKVAVLSKGGAPTPTYVPPDWLDPLPTFTFVEGTQSSQTFSGYFTDGNGGTSTITGQNLPSGVTVNSALRRFEYDGNGPVASSNTVTLTADDGYGENLTTLTVQDNAGTAGIVFKEGDIPSGSYIGSDFAGFQAIVKNRWPDGSAKIAVMSWSGVTASSGSPATLTIGKTTTVPTGAALTLATLRAANPSVSVALDSYGTATLASVINTDPVRQWQSGPQCSEWHWYKVMPDGQLVVWFYVRLYANGRIWVRTTVENGYLIQAGNPVQSSKKYHAVITINGTQRYSTATDSGLRMPKWRGSDYLQDGGGDPGRGQNWYWPWAQGDQLPHTQRTRWTRDFWYDGQEIQSPGHDGQYLINTKLWPNYAHKVNDSAGLNSYYVTAQTPMMNGNHRPYQPETAASIEICYVPKWDVLYLVSPQGGAGQKNIYKSVIANAAASDSYGFSRVESTMRVYVPTDGNGLLTWINPPYSGAWNPSDGDYNPPWVGDSAHGHSYAYTAYLVSGDYYFVETQQSRAVGQWIGLNYESREGIKGYLWGTNIQHRAFAWTMRDVAQASCVTPDSTDTASTDYKLKSFFNSFVKNNVDRYLASHVDGTLSGTNPINGYAYEKEPNSFGYLVAIYAYRTHEYFANEYEKPDQYRGTAAWQQAFIGLSLSATCDMKILSGSDATNLGRLTDFNLKLAVGMHGLGDANGWAYPWAGSGAVPFWRSIGGGAWQQAQNWTDCFDWKLSHDRTNDGNSSLPDIRLGLPASGAPMWNPRPYVSGIDPGIANAYVGEPLNWADGYWGNNMPALAYAVDRGVSGAAAAWSRLKSHAGTSNGVDGSWAYHNTGFDSVVQWGIKPRTVA